MGGQDNKPVLVAPAGPCGKPAARSGRPPQECGDIGLRIGRDGTWYYQDSPIGRKPLVKLFASVLRREDDGNYYLVTPVEKVPVAVEEVPFLAVSMQAEGEGEAQALSFRTNLDDVAVAGPAHPLSFRAEKDESFTPFILVREGLQARLVRSVYYDLVGAAVEKEGRLGVWSGGVFFPFPAPQE